MNLQYITDSKGKTTGVFIPIEEWLSIKEKLNTADIEAIELPQWHKDELDERLSSMVNEETQEYNSALNDIEKKLKP